MPALQPDLELLPPLTEAISFVYSVMGMQKPRPSTTGDEFAALRNEWEHLHSRSNAGVFLSWGWLYAWYQHLGRDRKLHIVTLRNTNDELDGILPLAIEERRLLGIKAGPSIKRMAFLGETHVGSDYLDVIAHHADREAITRRLLESVRDAGNWDLLDLNDMDSASPTLPLLNEVFGGGEFVVEVSDGAVCPYERFAPGETFDTFIKKLGRGSNYKRRRKWLEKQEGFRIKRATQPEEMDRALAEFLRLHELRWRGDGGSDGITCPETVEFHREATRYLAEQGNICLYTMMVGGQAVASFYALMHNGKMICYLTGRDPEWQQHSVGMVLVGETFRDAFEQGLPEYNFLRGEEPYKADWSTLSRRLVSVRIYHKQGKGAWLSRQENAVQSARKFGKKVIPSAIRRRLRRGNAC